MDRKRYIMILIKRLTSIINIKVILEQKIIQRYSYFIMEKGSIHQDDIILNIYVPNNKSLCT